MVTPSLDADRQLVIASRWDRLWASIIDGLIMMVIIMPVMYFTGAFDRVLEGVAPSLAYNLIVGAFGIIVFVVLNGKLLLKKGQTIGKRALGIKIVTLSDELPSFKKHLLKRYGLYFALGHIPLIGQLLSTINVLIIFSKQKRCGHDIVADTKVVSC